MLSLIIEDDGKGFEATDAAVMIGSDRGMGLPGMRERAERFGGKIEIESTLGKGTTVYVRVPCYLRRPKTPGYDHIDLHFVSR